MVFCLVLHSWLATLYKRVLLFSLKDKHFWLHFLNVFIGDFTQNNNFVLSSYKVLRPVLITFLFITTNILRIWLVKLTSKHTRNLVYHCFLGYISTLLRKVSMLK